MSTPPEDYWFKPKRHGYGAVPSNWKGVLATTAFAVLVPLVSVIWITSLSEETRLMGLAIWIFAMGYLVWRFKKFAERKTDGEWKWRWHGQAYRDMAEGKPTDEPQSR